jgi:subtilisin
LKHIIKTILGLILFLNLIISNLMISEEQTKIKGKITIKTSEDNPSPAKPKSPNLSIKPPIIDPNAIANLNITNTEKIKTDVGGQPIPFQYIIIFDDKFTANSNSLDTTFQALSLIVESLGGEVIFNYNNTIPGFAFKTIDQQKSDQILNILSLDPRVKYAEQDRIVVPFSQVVPSGIQRIGVENVAIDPDIEQISIDVDIAIIDSGIDLDHPDLNVFKNVTSIIPQIITSEVNTIRAKDINLNKIGLNVENNLTTFYPPFSQASSSTGDDNCGHGTHVAGIAAAKDNAFGVIGIAPGAKLWAIKVLDYDKNSGKCFGSISSVIAAIDYVTKNANQIDVANLSLGCKCNSTALDDAISKSISKNVVYVTAAGNIHSDASFFSPANHKEVLTVSAIADADGKCGSLGTPIWVDAGDFSGFSKDDTFASFSNYGSVVDIAAPGVKINSTYLNGTYALMGGTSIASPHVTGMIALYKSINPILSPKEISEKLTTEGLYPNTVCDGYSSGYFDQDFDNSPEPLLHSFDMVNIKTGDSNIKADPNFWKTFSDIAELK